MALPENTLSNPAVPAAYLDPYARARPPLSSWALGGIALEDATQGLEVQAWLLEYLGSPGDFLLTPEQFGPPTVLFSAEDVTECSLAFDQLMRPAIAFVEAGNVKLRWFDTQVNNTVITNFGSAIYSPVVVLDNPAPIASQVFATSDVLFFYLRAGKLYYRQQRDRYTIERELATLASPSALIIDRGKTVNNRLQLRVQTP
jgi:hypothetical protein